MRVLPLLAVLLVVVQSAWADPPAPPATRPALTVIDPVTPPSPMPGPATVVALEPGRFELIRLTGYQGKASWRVLPANGPVQCSRLKPGSQVLAAPPQAGDTPAIEVREAGTLVILGAKAGATGGGTYSVGDEPAVLVRPVRGKNGTATIEAWGINADGEPVLLVELLVQANHAPQPPSPTPGPTPDPKPPVDPTDPSPFPDSGFRVLMVFDSGNTTRPAAQNSVIYGKAVRDYLRAKCVPDPAAESGTDGRSYRVYPANVDVSHAPKVWADAHRLATAKGKDWILIGDGKRGYSGPLPTTEADTLALLKRYGGE